MQGGVVVASINKIHNALKDNSKVIKDIIYNTGAMIIDEAHRASSYIYGLLFEEASNLTNGKLFPVCGLSATPGRNTMIYNSDVEKLVDRFQMNLITLEFKDNEKYKENPLEY